MRSSRVHLQALEPEHCWAQMPKDWALILKGDSGDLTRFGVRDLTFAQAPGHCSGHVVYNHKPSGYMLAGGLHRHHPGGRRLIQDAHNVQQVDVQHHASTRDHLQVGGVTISVYAIPCRASCRASGASWHYLKVLHGPALLCWPSKRCVGVLCSAMWTCSPEDAILLGNLSVHQDPPSHDI